MCEAETHAFCLFYDVIIDKKMVEQSDEGWTGAHMEPFTLKFGDRRRKIARLASRQHKPWGKVSLLEKNVLLDFFCTFWVEQIPTAGIFRVC